MNIHFKTSLLSIIVLSSLLSAQNVQAGGKKKPPQTNKEQAEGNTKTTKERAQEHKEKAKALYQAISAILPGAEIEKNKNTFYYIKVSIKLAEKILYSEDQGPQAAQRINLERLDIAVKLFLLAIENNGAQILQRDLMYDLQKILGGIANKVSVSKIPQKDLHYSEIVERTADLGASNARITLSCALYGLANNYFHGKEDPNNPNQSYPKDIALAKRYSERAMRLGHQEAAGLYYDVCILEEGEDPLFPCHPAIAPTVKNMDELRKLCKEIYNETNYKAEIDKLTDQQELDRLLELALYTIQNRQYDFSSLDEAIEVIKFHATMRSQNKISEVRKGLFRSAQFVLYLRDMNLSAFKSNNDAKVKMRLKRSMISETAFAFELLVHSACLGSRVAKKELAPLLKSLGDSYFNGHKDELPRLEALCQRVAPLDIPEASDLLKRFHQQQSSQSGNLSEEREGLKKELDDATKIIKQKPTDLAAIDTAIGTIKNVAERGGKDKTGWLRDELCNNAHLLILTADKLSELKDILQTKQSSFELYERSARLGSKQAKKRLVPLLQLLVEGKVHDDWFLDTAAAENYCERLIQVGLNEAEALLKLVHSRQNPEAKEDELKRYFNDLGKRANSGDEEAFTELHTAAQAKSKFALFHLGNYYCRKSEANLGQDINGEIAMGLLKQAADQGLRKANYTMGILASWRKEHEKAVELLKNSYKRDDGTIDLDAKKRASVGILYNAKILGKTLQDENKRNRYKRKVARREDTVE